MLQLQSSNELGHTPDLMHSLRACFQHSMTVELWDGQSHTPHHRDTGQKLHTCLKKAGRSNCPGSGSSCRLFRPCRGQLAGSARKSL